MCPASSVRYVMIGMDGRGLLFRCTGVAVRCAPLELGYSRKAEPSTLTRGREDRSHREDPGEEGEGDR